MTTYDVPAGIKITDGTCKQLFSEVVREFPGAHGHHFLSDFLCKISESYKVDKCAGDFILDLLQLGVPDLFSGWNSPLYNACMFSNGISVSLNLSVRQHYNARSD